MAIIGLLSVSASTSVSAQFIQSPPTPRWTGAAFSGDDGFLGSVTAAYRNGSTASLFVVVNNAPDTSPNFCSCPLNVSAVKVFMDWGKNYSSTSPVPSVSTPVQIMPSQTMGFTITFTVPDITVASNLFVHNYEIIVEQVRSPHFGPPPAPILLCESPFGMTECRFPGFAVLSPDQAAAHDLIKRLDPILSGGSSVLGAFTSPQAKVLAFNLFLNFTRGDDLYKRGDFSGARSALQSASSLLSQAISAESSFETAKNQSTSAMNNSTVTVNKSTADLNNARMGSENIRAWGFLLAGLGVVVAGAAGVIYAIKRPTHSMSTTASHSSGQ